jgi:hypothetical protein
MSSSRLGGIVQLKPLQRDMGREEKEYGRGDIGVLYSKK